MKAFKILIIMAFSVFTQGEDLCGQNLWAEIISPAVVEPNDILTLVIRIRNEDMSLNASVNGTFQLILSQGTVEDDSIQIYMGTGSLTTKISCSQHFYLSVDGFFGAKEIIVMDNAIIKEVGGLYGSDLTLFADTIYKVTQDLTVTENAILEIQKGCRIYPEENVNIFIGGKLTMDGTPDEPILVRSFDPEKKWGGLFIQNNTLASEIMYSFFIFGGNDENYIFGHSESQPVIMADHSSLYMTNTFIIDNPGKALGGYQSQFKIDNCLFSRCDAGGEYHYCYAEITGTYFIDFPVNDGIPSDDDNDASYFYNVHPLKDDASLIQNCVFINGKDDGIDHQGAKLHINNCWIQGFDNEGIAASGFNYVQVFNTVVRNCGQGIEAGYGSPQVMVNHCLLIENGVGLRFGDSYDWGSNGQIQASNSIFFENDNNIHNFDILTQGPVAGAIEVAYSMTNDPEYDDYPGCMAAVPLFAWNYLLLPESPGKGMGSDGMDMGLLSTLLTVREFHERVADDVIIFPNPSNSNGSMTIASKHHQICRVRIYYFNGLQLYSQDLASGEKTTEISLSSLGFLPSGLYYFSILLSDGTSITEKAIIH